MSEITTIERLRQKGLRVVGWYHSHPVFRPEPSLRDIENQQNFQHFNRDEHSGSEPFVGFIIGT